MAKPKAKPLTLTQAAYAMRKILLATGITLLVIIVGRIFLESAVNFWVNTHPKAPPPPTVGFGILPRLAFPESVAKPTSFRLEASAATMKATSDRAMVFFQPSKRASLLALDKASVQAKTLEFIFPPERITSESYRWRRTDPLPAVLDYNIVNGTFVLRVDWQSNPSFLQGNRLPDEDSAINTARNKVSEAGLLAKDMATGSAKVTYLKSNNGSYTNTVSFSEADFLQVDLFRTPVFGQFPILTERPNRGTIRAIISGSQDRSQQIIALDYSYLPVDYTVLYTYPIIPPTAAYQMLSAGNGYSASIAEGQTEAIIRNVYLAYFDSGSKPQSYMQPIYVFEGDGGYVGYVPAIDPKWISPQ
ncbi:MAG: hypothetical protein ABI758_04440 [Candidatus Woesebacteria bacterium]